MSVDFQINADFSEVDKMLKRYKDKALNEYKIAIDNTLADGLKTAIINTPHSGGNLQDSWRAVKRITYGTIYNFSKYVNAVNDGWKRTKPILPKKAKVLIFQVGKRNTARSSGSEVLYERYKKAIKSLKGKGLSPREKAIAATNKSGVVITKKVSKGASFKGYHFIENKIMPKVADIFTKQMSLAIDRILR